jgi:hypothetical protein
MTDIGKAIERMMILGALVCVISGGLIAIAIWELIKALVWY